MGTATGLHQDRKKGGLGVKGDRLHLRVQGSTKVELDWSGYFMYLLRERSSATGFRSQNIISDASRNVLSVLLSK